MLPPAQVKLQFTCYTWHFSKAPVHSKLSLSEQETAAWQLTCSAHPLTAQLPPLRALSSTAPAVIHSPELARGRQFQDAADPRPICCSAFAHWPTAACDRTWLGFQHTTALRLAAACDTNARDTTCLYLRFDAGGPAGQ